MIRPANLISDSPVVDDILTFAIEKGGRIRCTEIAEAVLRMNNVSDDLAAALVADFTRNDSRLTIEGPTLIVAQTNDEDRPLSEIDFVILDVEAIGGRSIPSRIIEIGACHLCGGEIDRQFETLVRSEMRLPRFVSSLTGITDAMLATAPGFADVADSWLEFIADSVLVAHNSNFDVGLLNREIARVFPGCKMRNSELCTVQLSRRVAPFLENHNLDALADYCGFEITQRHRALPDAMATARILLRLLDELEIRGVRTLTEARAFRFSNPTRIAANS